MAAAESVRKVVSLGVIALLIGASAWLQAPPVHDRIAATIGTLPTRRNTRNTRRLSTPSHPLCGPSATRPRGIRYPFRPL
jgi:hypothetical protein